MARYLTEGVIRVWTDTGAKNAGGTGKFQLPLPIDDGKSGLREPGEVTGSAFGLPNRDLPRVLSLPPSPDKQTLSPTYSDVMEDFEATAIKKPSFEAMRAPLH